MFLKSDIYPYIYTFVGSKAHNYKASDTSEPVSKSILHGN